jgi:hypothetical protein
VNTVGTLRVRVTKVGSDTALAQIVALVQQRLTELKMRLLSDRVSRRTAGRSRPSRAGRRPTTRNTSPSPKLQADALHREPRTSDKGQAPRTAGIPQGAH